MGAADFNGLYLSPFVHLTVNVLGFSSSGAEPRTVSQMSEAGVQQRLPGTPLVFEVRRCS